MSFVDRESIMGLTEDLLAASWFEEFGELRIPFDRIRYEDAIEFYGTDKPDLRLPYKVRMISILSIITKKNEKISYYFFFFLDKKHYRNYQKI